MIYGYVRHLKVCDAARREECRQLVEAGCYEVRCDAYAGAKDDRPELMKLLELLEPGDTVLTPRLDCLGPTLCSVLTVAERVWSVPAALDVLGVGRMDMSERGMMLQSMLRTCAAFEEDGFQRRAAEGRAAAAAHESRIGRRPKFSSVQLDHAMELLADYSYRQVACMTGISKATLVRERQRRRIKEH